MGKAEENSQNANGFDCIKHPFSCGRLSDEAFAQHQKSLPNLPDGYRFFFFIYDGVTQSVFGDNWAELIAGAIEKYKENTSEHF